MKTKDATLVKINKYGVQLRKASKKSDTWPGWACELGKAGYWIGNNKQHTYIGRYAHQIADSSICELYELSEA